MNAPRPHIGHEEEAVLVHQACAGDSHAFGTLVDRYKGPVYRLCLRYVRDPDAEDLAQETFLRAFVNRERFDVDRPFLPWLLVIARNLCLDRLRGRRREPGADADVSSIAHGGPTAEETVSTREAIEDLERSLARLPEGQREAIAMYHFDGLSYREMADVMDAPVGTIMTWLHRGRARLRELMRSGGDETTRNNGGARVAPVGSDR